MSFLDVGKLEGWKVGDISAVVLGAGIMVSVLWRGCCAGYRRWVLACLSWGVVY